MPLPPPKPRKHPDLPASEARSQHLSQYRFQPGQSADPSGMSQGATQDSPQSASASIVIKASPPAKRLARIFIRHE
jgi:hypothetical protein